MTVTVSKAEHHKMLSVKTSQDFQSTTQEHPTDKVKVYPLRAIRWNRVEKLHGEV